MENNHNLELAYKTLNLISEGKLTELEAERLFNSIARVVVGVPTGVRQQHDEQV